MPRVPRYNYYKLKHKAVNEGFEGGLTFCNSFDIKNKNVVCAVYKVAKPNRSKGHKDLLLLFRNPDGRMYVAGEELSELGDRRYQEGVHCLNCKRIIFSMNGHDFKHCKCGECFVDGGREYLRIGFKDKNTMRIVKLDLIDNVIVPKEIS